MSDETTTEQLAEIEGQTESTPVTKYTPPEGWRVLQVGERLRDGDVTVRRDGYQYPTERVGGWVGSNQRYIRPIEPEPQPEPQPEPIQVREGRWRTRNGLVKDVTAMPTNHEDFAAAYPWWDGVSTWRNDGRWLAGGSTMDLLEYLGPIEPDKTQKLPTKTQELPDKTQELPKYTPPEGWRVLAVGEELRQGDMWVWPTDDQLRQTVHIGAVVGANQRYIRPIEPDKPQPQPAEYTPPEGWRVLRSGEVLQRGDHWVNWEGTVSRPDIQHGDGATASGGRYIRNIDIELQTVQNQLGESRQRVTQLEELVASLRTINRGCENAVRDAGKENFALKNQLAAVKAELASVAADRQQLRVELDAAQQVPADSPELRQLRADLAEMTRERDQHLDSYQRIFGDLRTIRETAKAEAVEAIAEWLEPIRLVDSAYLANATMQHLPQIMRHLTGLDSYAID